MAPTHRIPELLTPRLYLRGFTPDDVPAIHAAYGDAAAMRYWNHAPSPDLERTDRYVRGWMKIRPLTYMIWAIALREDDRCIGMVNYHTRDTHNARVEIGYILVPSEQGRGFMTEALTVLITHLRAALRVHRIEAQIEPDNLRSRAVVERLGFTLEAPLLRDRWRVGKAFRSVAMYSLVTS
jgi:ribosomal-protein-alanine N-acetyltransferase